MNAFWTYRLRFIRRHLTMLLMALCIMVLQSQLAIAAHQCQLNVVGESAMAQHMTHQNAPAQKMDMSLCGKHCLPDDGQQSVEHPPLVALPVSMTIALVDTSRHFMPGADWDLKPPAAGPPATLRFCRFRE